MNRLLVVQVFVLPPPGQFSAEINTDGSLDVLGDEDQKVVMQLYKLISDAAEELAPNLQIIVMDHADLKPDWFKEAVVERWRHGRALIPDSWIT